MIRTLAAGGMLLGALLTASGVDSEIVSVLLLGVITVLVLSRSSHR